MAAVVYFRSIFGIASFGILLCGFYEIYYSVEKNRCEMTYMFEYPEYIKQNLPRNVTEKFPQYQLYLYGEGKYAERLRREKLQGFPVLFVPGNAGSHRQVRSFASVALRMSQSLNTFHFNFFSVDFHEEISALYGGVLWRQTAFLKESITHIISLYPERKKSEIIIIAHSMGGMIVKSLFAISDFDSTLIKMIFNLATPQRASVIEMDKDISNFYDMVNNIWKLKRRTDMKNIPTVNIGGGQRDFLVKSDLALADSEWDLDINSLTTAIPKVWLSTDHLCILWCKALVLQVVRSIFEIAENAFVKTIQDEKITKDILHHYFKRSSNIYSYKASIPYALFHFGINCEWINKEEYSWRYIKKKLLGTTYLVMPVFQGEDIVVLTAGLHREDWIAACHKSENNTSLCDKGESLSEQGQLLPENKLMILISANTLLLRGHTHIAIHLAPSHSVVSKQTVVNVIAERYQRRSRCKVAIMPNLVQSFISAPHQLLNVPITEGAVFYNLSLKGLTDVWQAYVIVVETLVCRATELGNGLAKFVVPWGSEDNYFIVKSKANSRVVIPGQLYLPKPHSSTAMAQLHLFLAPECSYSVLVEVRFSLILAQFVKFYGTMVFTYLTALLLIALSAQIRNFTTKGICLPILSALSGYPTFIVLVLLPEVLQFVSVFDLITSLPKSDGQILFERQHYFFLLRTLLYLVAYGVLTLLILSSTCVLYIGAFLTTRIRKRVFVNPEVKPSSKENFSLLVIAEFFLLSACLLALPGALILFAAFFLLIFQLSYLCGKNQIEKDRRGLSISSSRWNVHQTLFLLKLLLCVMSSPSLISWVRNIHVSSFRQSDPHTWPVLVITLCGSILWQYCIPCKAQVHPKMASFGILIIAVVTTTHCLVNIWRITYLLSATFAIVAAQQFASWKKDGKQD